MLQRCYTACTHNKSSVVFLLWKWINQSRWLTTECWLEIGSFLLPVVSLHDEARALHELLARGAPRRQDSLCAAQLSLPARGGGAPSRVQSAHLNFLSWRMAHVGNLVLSVPLFAQTGFIFILYLMLYQSIEVTGPTAGHRQSTVNIFLNKRSPGNFFDSLTILFPTRQYIPFSCPALNPCSTFESKFMPILSLSTIIRFPSFVKF